MWTSEVGLYQRYVLTLQFDIQIDKSKPSIVVLREPRFVLNEVTSVREDTNGGYQITFGEDWKFSRSKWVRVYQKGGDLNAIGISIEEHKPVANFDKALMER